METNNSNETNNLITLVGDLKTKDLRYSNLSRGMQIVYFILIPFYIIITGVELFNEFSLFILFKGISFISAMTIFAIIFTKYQKEYRNVDYSEPTLVMLKKAAYRYKPFRKEVWWAFLAVILIDCGMLLSTHGLELDMFFQITFLSGLVVGILAGLLIYKIKYKPIRDAALKMIKDIENG